MARTVRTCWKYYDNQPLVAALFTLLVLSTCTTEVTGANASLSLVNLPLPLGKSNLCFGSPCQNNATCLVDSSASNPDSPGFTCVCPTTWTGRLCDVDIDECSDSLNRCKNGAMCRNYPGGFQCYCVPGYLGKFCDREANECLAKPCENGATCLDRLNGYECLCLKGYRGSRCEEEINECLPNPCHNGAMCTDLPGAYNCTCPLGFRGVNCEVNIDNCEVDLCHNGGRCVDGVNNFTCNCVDTGFAGRFCEHEIDDCASSPCQHNGTCKDIGKDYRCRCFDGYLGKNCEVDIDECQEPRPPCRNNATCYERSNISLYLDRKLLGLDRAFSYEHSAGYVCVCGAGFQGTNCEVEIDECLPLPCVHGKCRDLLNAYQCDCVEGWEGKECQRDIDECQVYGLCSQHGRCENTLGAFSCKCDVGFGGWNCSVPLTGCDEDVCPDGVTCPSFPKCAEGSSCQPYLAVESPSPVHNFTCICPAGRGGRYCQSSSVAAFSSDGFLQLLNQSLLNVSLDFRTTLNDSILMIAFERALVVAVQINRGRVEIVVNDLDDVKTVTFTRTVSDGKWYTVGLWMEGSVVGGAGGSGGGVRALLRPTEFGFGGVAEEKMLQLKEFEPADILFSEVFIGGVEHRVRVAGSSFRSNMIGCMRDININGDVLVPVEMNSNTRRRQPAVRSVCERKEQCTVNTCNRRGRCSDLWNHYECVCERPYYGLSCEKEISAGTFGNENSTSLVVLNLTEADRSDLELRNQLSFRLRTLENDSVIFYLGSEDASTFVVLRLVGGRLVLNVKLSDVVEPIYGPLTLVGDGAFHTVDVQRDQTMVEMTVDGGQPTFGQLASGSPLKAEVLVLGQTVQGIKGDKGTKVRVTKRQVAASGSGGGGGGGGGGGAFKGVLQDVRMNGKLVPFFGVTESDQLERLPPTYQNVTVVDVLEGVISDDTCRSAPCQNGGTCEITWNDFRCTCPVAFRGKTCELANFCLSNECPSPQAQCKKLEDDYECQASISFLDTGGYVTYIPTKTASSFRKVSLRFRTRSTDAKNLLSITSTLHQLKFYIKNSRVQIEYRLSATPSVVTIDHPVTDAVWHNFTAEFLERQMNIAIDGQSFTQDIALSDVSLNGILLEENAYVQLGGDFVGCVEDVRLGRQLLPLFPLLPIHVMALRHRRLVSVEKMNGVQYGCRGVDVCKVKPCLKGKCVDVWNDRRCECDPEGVGGVGGAGGNGGCGKMGSRMDPLVEACADMVCQNGGKVVCEESSDATNFTQPWCECLDGYTGTACETHVALSASPPDQLAIILGVTLSVAFLLLLIALTAFCITARRKRAERGTYSPNRQEHFGRVEMDFVLKPPPKEGLI